MYLLDTNICSALIREDERVEKKLAVIDNNLIYINWVIASELRYGAVKKGSKKLNIRVNEMLDMFTVLQPNESIIESYAKVRHQLTIQGKQIGSNDLWIASHALVEGLIVVTNNVKEFSRVDNLVVEDWLV